MTETVVLINKSTDTFDGWVDKTNELANLVSNAAFTATATVGGSHTTGNAYGNGVFSYSTLTANVALRGGNVSTSAVLSISSNVNISGNLVISGSTWRVGTGAINVSSNTTAVTLANSTVTYSFTKPTAAQFAAANYFLNADGTWANVENLVLKVYDSANTQLFP
jgi:hypothetical protein